MWLTSDNSKLIFKRTCVGVALPIIILTSYLCSSSPSAVHREVGPNCTCNTSSRPELPEIKSSSAYPIHIAFVGISESSLTGLGITVKTLLHHTTSPITFHLIGDHKHLEYLQKLIRSDDTVEFYQWEQYAPLVDFIPNIHYGGVYAMLKLIIPEMLPARVKQIAVLDTDLLFNADVMELWQHFDRFDPHQALAIAEENSGWYNDHKWPAVKKGFNSGVMLMHVEKLRKMGWYWFWRGEVLQPILKLGKTELGDQDVFNYLAKSQPTIMFRLPCTWNRQWILRPTSCADPIEDKAPIKILHWNRRDKKIVIDDLPEDFKSLWEKIGGLN